MSKVLIIPDIHESLDKLTIIEDVFMPKADRVVCLGDWFDTFKQRMPEAVCHTILRFMKDDRVTMLCGNHDCQYVFNHPMFRCSGFNWQTAATIKQLIQKEIWQQFKLFTHVGTYLVSHAGFCIDTIAMAHPTIEKEALTKAFAGEFHPIFAPGRARGGYEPYGGCTWLDWNKEFDGVVPQIVGHTMGKVVRQRDEAVGTSYCVDTGLNHVMWVDDVTNDVTIERVEL
jgi:hypothetical protein